MDVGHLHTAEFPGGIGILKRIENVSAIVIGVGDAFVLGLAVVTNQLVEVVVGIGLLQDPILGDGDDIAVVVVGVGEFFRLPLGLGVEGDAVGQLGGLVGAYAPGIGVAGNQIVAVHGDEVLVGASEAVVGGAVAFGTGPFDPIYPIGAVDSGAVDIGYGLLTEIPDVEIVFLELILSVVAVSHLDTASGLVLEGAAYLIDPHQSIGQVVGIPGAQVVRHVFVQPHHISLI